MTDPDERPRPQFGEYASPEEQRASIKVPRDQAHAESVPIPASRDQGAQHPQRALQQNSAPDARRASGTGSPFAAPRSIDRFATFALLALGFLNILTTAPGLLNLSTTLDTAFKQMGVGEFTATPTAAGIGIGLAIFYGVAWLVTLLISLRSLRAGRLTFWIPLVAGVIVTLVAMACFLVLFFNDPSFMAYVTKNGG